MKYNAKGISRKEGRIGTLTPNSDDAQWNLIMVPIALSIKNDLYLYRSTADQNMKRWIFDKLSRDCGALECFVRPGASIECIKEWSQLNARRAEKNLDAFKHPTLMSYDDSGKKDELSGKKFRNLFAYEHATPKADQRDKLINLNLNSHGNINTDDIVEILKTTQINWITLNENRMLKQHNRDSCYIEYARKNIKLVWDDKPL